MSKRILLWGLIIISMVVILVACDSGGDEASNDIAVLPTLMPTPTVFTRPTLPPTYTPTTSPTPTATVTVTPTPEGFNPFGILLYVYNGDSIVRMRGDGSDSELIVTFGVGAEINDLTLSPDGTLLAFTAPGNGSAREVYVANLDGTYLQQVSCLGFSVINHPAWSADSLSLAFTGAQAEGQGENIYSADIAGSGNCPVDNNQRMIVNLDSQFIGDIAWDPLGRQMFYSDQAIYSYDFETGETEGPYTQISGFGSEYNLGFRPNNPGTLTFIRPAAPTASHMIETIIVSTSTTETNTYSNFALDYDWLARGQFLLLSTDNRVIAIDYNENDSEVLVSGLQIMGQAVFNGRADFISYIDLDPVNPDIQQVFTYDDNTRQTTQITTHPEGTVNDIIWVPESD